MAQPRELGYNAYDLLQGDVFADTFDENNGTYQNSFGDPVASSAINSGSLVGLLQQEYGAIFAGKGSFNNTETGYRLGIDESDELAKFYIGNSVSYLNWTGSALNIAGVLTASEIHIPDLINGDSFHVDASGNMWIGDPVFASAPARIEATGDARFNSVTITGGAITGTPIASIPNNTSTDVSLLEKTWTMAFSVTDNNTVAWTSGTITLSNGRTFSINSGNTGNMAALTYIYLDPAVSTTALQTTTTASTAMGGNKVLIGCAQNNTVTASFIPYGPGQPLVDGANIGALSIVASNIAASTITAAKMSVSSLSAIAADMGTITAGTITLNTTGFIRGGATGYLTGTGFFLGYSSGYKFSVGNPSGKYIAWDGSDLIINGYAAASKGSFGGDGSDGAYSRTSGLDTVNLGGVRIFIKNYSSFSMTGSGNMGFSNPHEEGTIIIFRVSGNCTINSSNLPTIDLRNKGAEGGVIGTYTDGKDASFNPYSALNVYLGALAPAGDSFGGGGASSINNGTTSGSSTGGVAPFPNIGSTDVEALLLFGYSFILPGGGGAPSRDSGAPDPTDGGRGGGAFILEVAGTLTFVGSNAINANGTDSLDDGGNNGGAGGAGSIVVLYNTAGTITGTVTASSPGGNGVAGGTGFAVVGQNKYF